MLILCSQLVSAGTRWHFSGMSSTFSTLALFVPLEVLTFCTFSHLHTHRYCHRLHLSLFLCSTRCLPQRKGKKRGRPSHLLKAMVEETLHWFSNELILGVLSFPGRGCLLLSWVLPPTATTEEQAIGIKNLQRWSDDYGFLTLLSCTTVIVY